MENIFIWANPEQGRSNDGIDVSSHGSHPYSKLSPFSYSSINKIPAPGSEFNRSDSVEGIWQGLKIIKGEMDTRLFKNKPKKRDGKVEGHHFGGQILGYEDARKHIYVPAYTYHVINNALPFVKDDLEARLQQGHPIILHDVESNPEISDLSSPYSHSALLVELLNMMHEAPLPPFSDKRFANLDNQLRAVLSYREKLDEKHRELLDEVISFAYLFSQDTLKSTFALRAISQGNMEHKGRLDRFTPNAKTALDYAAALTF